VPIIIKSKQPSCNYLQSVISLTARFCLHGQCRVLTKVWLIFAAISSSQLPFWRTCPILTSNCAGFQRNLHIDKVDSKICSLLLQET